MFSEPESVLSLNACRKVYLSINLCLWVVGVWHFVKELLMIPFAKEAMQICILFVLKSFCVHWYHTVTVSYI